MSDVNNILPQVGRAVSPESHSINVMDCPKDSEGGKQSTFLSILEDSNIINPFARRDSIQRTPPRDRSSSLSELDPKPNGEEKPTKRKRINYSPDKEEEDSSFSGHTLKSTIQKIGTQVRRLENIIKKGYKTKKEICEISSKLSLYMEMIEILDSKEVVDRMNQNTTGGDLNAKLEHLQRENDELRENISVIKINQKEYQDRKENEKEALVQQIVNLKAEKDIQTHENSELEFKCEACRKMKTQKLRRQELIKDQTFDNFQAVTEKDWKTNIFENPILNEYSIWEVPAELDVILPCNENFVSQNKAISRAIENFGGLEGLKKQKKRNGEVACMQHSVGFPDDDGRYKTTTRWIYYPIISEKSSNSDSEDILLFNALANIKEKIVQNNRTYVAFPETDNVLGVVFTRMITFLFANTPIQIYKYASSAGKPRMSGVNQSRQTTSKESRVLETTRKETRKPKQDALLIQMKNRSYADLLKTVKTAINPSQIGVEVKDLKKTRNGGLILRIQNGADKAEVLKKEIVEKVPGAVTSVLVNKKVLHLKGMDEIADADEIKEAVCKAISVTNESFEVRALRPAFGDKQNATLILQETDANKLLAMKEIRIGWSKCKILERKKETRCYKCWEYGHIRDECEGPDRTDLCIKCCQEGHKADKCKNKPYCLHCKIEGHQTYSQRCEILKKRKEAEVSSKNNTPNENTTD